jgi:general secretion pathway protein A
MYAQAFGLVREPFSMTPDPGALFMTEPHREALAGLTYAILTHKGFVVLTGDAGTGKTTLLAHVLDSLPSKEIVSSVILNPLLTPAEFLEMALIDFGVTDVPASKAQRLIALQHLLMKVREKRRTAVLVIDEAHKLSPELLEEVRLLSDFELPDDKLLQIVLSGQNELGPLLNREDLRQLKQRIAVRVPIRALSAEETARYIQHRWRHAGGASAAPFDAEAVELVAAASRGIPRLVNALCDNALLLAFADGLKSVTARQVREAARDLDVALRPAPLEAETPRAPVTPAAEEETGAAGEFLDVPFIDRWIEPPAPSRLRRLAARLGLAS